MKKTLAILLVGVITIASIFALAPGNTGFKTSNDPAAITTDSASSEVSFKLERSKIEAYSIGFCSSAPTLGGAEATFSSGIPSPKTSVALSYDKSSNTATNATVGSETDDLYYYYKVRAAKAPTITISGTAMTDGNNTINFTATATNSSGTLNTANEGFITAATTNFKNGYGTGFGQITIVTSTTLNASFANDSTAYTGKITIKIASNS